MPTEFSTGLELAYRLKAYKFCIELLEGSTGMYTICGCLHLYHLNQLHTHLEVVAPFTIYDYPEICKRKPAKKEFSEVWWPLRNVQRRIKVCVEAVDEVEKKIHASTNALHKQRKKRNVSSAPMYKNKFNSY